MPPKIKVTEDAILETALELTREKGIAGLNARELAKTLGCSVQPVFRRFQSMENLKKELYHKAERLFDACMARGMERCDPPFLGMGLSYIEFAKKEKNLFKFLFMSDEFGGKNLPDVIREEENQTLVQMVAAMTGFDRQNAEELFMGIWLMTHGIASMMATNDCNLSQEQIIKLLKDTFSGMKRQLSEQGEAPWKN